MSAVIWRRPWRGCRTADMPDWDFATDPADALTHGIHPYPANLMPLVAERVIGSPDGSVFDSFFGSGTTLLEANMQHQHAVGYAPNPLAVMIQHTRSAEQE